MFDLCQIPTSPISGFVNFTNLGYFKSLATFYCDEGYSLYGPSTKICQGDGWFWPIDDSVCIPDVLCDPPPRISDSSIQSANSPFIPGSTVIYVCNEGFEVNRKGETRFSIYCTSKGQWIGLRQFCIRAGCKVPSDDKMYIHPDYESNVQQGTRLQVQCKSGYKSADPTPVKVITCTPTGWDNDFLRCEEINDCIAPDIPENSAYLSEIYPGDRIKHGSIEEIRCIFDGTWDNNSAFFVGCNDGRIYHNITQCVKKEPACIVQLYDGVIYQSHDIGDILRIGESFSYTCEQANPQSMSFCVKSGDLSPLPTCNKGCKSAPPMSHWAWPIYLSTQHGATAHYECFAGYRLQNESIKSITCNNGKWTRPVPKCVPGLMFSFFL
ncbi:hypothetical protein ACOME3_007956 [Neoechinorhynchus agilis]